MQAVQRERSQPHCAPQLAQLRQKNTYLAGVSWSPAAMGVPTPPGGSHSSWGRPQLTPEGSRPLAKVLSLVPVGQAGLRERRSPWFSEMNAPTSMLTSLSRRREESSGPPLRGFASWQGNVFSAYRGHFTVKHGLGQRAWVNYNKVVSEFYFLWQILFMTLRERA